MIKIINVVVCYYINNKNKVVIDKEGMTKDFETQLDDLQKEKK